jgi:hypothetical protein
MNQKEYESLPLTTETFDSMVFMEDDNYYSVEELQDELVEWIACTCCDKDKPVTEEVIREILAEWQFFPCKEHLRCLPACFNSLDSLAEAILDDEEILDPWNPIFRWTPDQEELAAQKLKELREILEEALPTWGCQPDQTKRYDLGTAIDLDKWISETVQYFKDLDAEEA